MMMTLKEYQQGSYKLEKAEVEEVAYIINTVLPLYCHSFLTGQWPYGVHVHEDEEQKSVINNYSASTNAMILVTLEYLLKSKLVQGDSKKCGKINIDEVVKKAKERYLSEVFTNDTFATNSGSYGINDPLNIYWATQICADPQYDAQSAIISKYIRNTVTEDIEKQLELKFNSNKHIEKAKEGLRIIELYAPDDVKEKFDINNVREELHLLRHPSPVQQPHAFIALYTLRGARSLGLAEQLNENGYYEFFEQRMHQHLSFHSIPDSRFDPAELVFCLEGALLCQQDSISSEILERVLQVLKEAQNTTPSWRPVNPIYAFPQGQIFLPLSIEVGNSLLRVFKNIKDQDLALRLFAQYITIFQRYFRWLKAQLKTITIRANGSLEKVSGWESEHVGNGNEIHLWQTAMVLQYLADYADLLQNHIARQYLEASGLAVVIEQAVPCGSCDFLDYNPYPQYSFEFNVPEYVCEHYLFPQVGAHRKCKFAKKVEEKELAAKRGRYSLLLYGPPGTGKTYFTQQMARCLGWKHITVTPSDFLADGSAEIEARAKAIFACLMEQRRAVILFDEIDQFILDRDSKRYNDQTDVFKLLTPGMLPKFQDLRDKGQCIFVIATNYAERIDAAVVRPGRIDKRLPLMPPDFTARLTYWEKCKFITDAKELAEKTVFYTWKEIRLLKKYIDSKGGTFTGQYPDASISYKTIYKRIDLNNMNEIPESLQLEIMLLHLSYIEEEFNAGDLESLLCEWNIESGRMKSFMELKKSKIDPYLKRSSNEL